MNDSNFFLSFKISYFSGHFLEEFIPHLLAMYSDQKNEKLHFSFLLEKQMNHEFWPIEQLIWPIKIWP